ncbi:MAG: AraC family transcriptional regulator [Acetatifactor sp.]|nr:AraC family transcriptional regulator [Acetatifactor sp.]
MRDLYEYSDILKSPIEAFYMDSKTWEGKVESHWHYFVEFIYMESGAAYITCNDHIYHVKEGEMIFLPPQAVHSIYSDENDSHRYICVKFNSNRVRLAGTYLPGLNDVFHQIQNHPDQPVIFSGNDLDGYDLKNLFTVVEREVRERRYGYDAYVYARFSELFSLLLRKWYYMGLSFENKNITEDEELSIQNILVYIDRHSAENINVANLANMCNMSYSYFAKLFCKHYGRSCKQYIEFIRLNKVESYLLYTDYDLNYIAAETGFADCSHLIRSFHKRYNITPKQFRLLHVTGFNRGR